MSFFKKSKLSTKIAIGFGAVIVILMLTIIFGYHGLSKNSDDFSDYRRIAKNNVLASRIQTILLDNQIIFKDFIATGDASSQNKFEDNFKEMEDLINEAKGNIVNKERDKKIDLIYEYAHEYQQGFKEISDFQAKRNTIVLDILTEKGTVLKNNISKLLELSFQNKNDIQSYKISEIQKDFLEARLNVGKFLEDNKEHFSNSTIEEFIEIDKELKELDGIISNEDEQELLDLIIKDKNTYINKFQEVVSLINSRNEKIEELNTIGFEISAAAEEIKTSIIKDQEAFGPKIKGTNDRALALMVVLSLIAIGLSILVSVRIIKLVIFPVKTVTNTFKGFSEGETDLKVRLKANTSDEIGEMGTYFNKFMEKLQVIIDESEKQNWLKTGQSELNEKIRGEQDISNLAYNIISYVCNYLKAQVGAIYLKKDDNTFTMISSYAYKKRKNLNNEIKNGEGLVGQCGLEKQIIVLTNVPEDYVTINSGLGEAVPRNILVAPCIYHEDVNCIIELGSFYKFSDTEIDFIEHISEIIAISINTAKSRTKMKELLDNSLKQTEELQLQQEELQQTNEELEEQTKALRESESNLQEQQEELQIINEELKQQTDSLKKQKDEINKKNQELEIAREIIQEKVDALELADKYKSEFFANMSHELRTPLNSILILSKMLSDKKENSVITKKDLEFAGTIYSSGSDLLNLINDILDLSKVEAGKMEINAENMSISELAYDIEHSFSQIAIEKELKFTVDVSDELPNCIYTDTQRVKQIVNNLISNAFKFTEAGAVAVNIDKPEEKEIGKIDVDHRKAIKISVNDTGIGIPADKQKLIFEAFKQSDGTISRKYGGTGLGLSISKELIRLLSGSITLESEEGKGTTFTIIIPEQFNEEESNIELEEQSKSNEEICVANESEKSSNELLIVEDNKDQRFSISELLSNEGFKITAVASGKEAYNLLKNKSFDCIVLDLGLKDMTGSSLLETLKKENLLEIPIIIYTGKELSQDEEINLKKYTQTIIIKGPKSMERLVSEVSLFINNISSKNPIRNFKTKKIDYSKDIKLKGKKVLIVDDDMRSVFALTSMLEEENIDVIVGKNGKEGIKNLKNNPDTDLVLMDIMMPEIDGYTAMKEIRKIERFRHIPIIALTAKAMKEDRNKCIEAGANDYLTKPVDINNLISLLRMWLHK